MNDPVPNTFLLLSLLRETYEREKSKAKLHSKEAVIATNRVVLLFGIWLQGKEDH